MAGGERGPNAITSIASVGDADEKNFIYTAGSDGAVNVWGFTQNFERPGHAKEPKDQGSNYLWIHKFVKMTTLPVAHSGPVTDMLNANGTLTTVSDDMSVVVWKQHVWDAEAFEPEERFQQEVGFTHVFSDGEVKAVCSNKFDLVVGDATGKVNVVQPAKYLVKYKYTRNEKPKGFKSADKIFNDAAKEAALCPNYALYFGDSMQQGPFKLKQGYDLNRLWFSRGKKANPPFVPLAEFFDSTPDDPKASQEELTTLGRAIVPIAWLWEVADIVATMVKPPIPFDLTVLGNDILPNLDNPEDAAEVSGVTRRPSPATHPHDWWREGTT